MIALTILMILAAVLAPRIPQRLSYHNFADQRGWLGIPNFGDFVSNMGFAIVGASGLVVFFPAGESKWNLRSVDSTDTGTRAAICKGAACFRH